MRLQRGVYVISRMQGAHPVGNGLFIQAVQLLGLKNRIALDAVDQLWIVIVVDNL